MKIIKTDNFILTYSDNQEIKNKVFDAIIDWCKKYVLFDSKSIMQADNAWIEAPILLSNIAENIIKFNIEWK